MSHRSDHQGKIYNLHPTVFSQLWGDVKAKIDRKIFRKTSVPWMRHKEIDLLGELIDNLQPRKSFEWGAGFSTIFYPQLLDENSTWHALEHNLEWYNQIKTLNNRSNVKISHVFPDNKDFKDDGSYEDFKTYINFPKETYDFILVDGRARKDCLEKAYQIISDRGIVVLHDANRKKYHEPFKMYKNSFLLTDYHKNGGGLWFGSKNTTLESVIDVQKHLKIWKKHRLIGQFAFKKS
jgi:predicted O-methyltransferase YrrM